MRKTINYIKMMSIGCWALFLSFIAITAVEFSYVLGGLNWLDPLIFLLIPAFIFLIIQLILTSIGGTKDYFLAFIILAACILFSLFRLSNAEVGIASDMYHNLKIVAFSIKNDFFTQLQYGKSDGTLFISDFIESIWGIFWRWTHWDLIIAFLEALPIVLLWHQLVHFFQKQKITTFPGLSATVIVLSLEILWCQQGFTYIDSIVGIFIGITLLLSYNFLSPPYERRFSYLAGLAFISGLCIISKPTGLCVGILGLGTAFYLGFRYLDTPKKVLLPMAALPSVIYFIYHQIQVWIQKGSFFYPYVTKNNSLHFFSDYYKIPFHLRLPSWISDMALHFKPLYILISWLSDYKLELDLSPCPFIRGNGLVFTYLVIPALIFWIFQHRNILKKKLWKDPRLIIFGVILLYYCSFEGSAETRFALGYNIFILSWCLAYLWQCLEQSRNSWLRKCSPIIICLLLLMALGSYYTGIRRTYMESHKISILSIQKEIFPHPYTPEIRAAMIQKLSDKQKFQ